MEVVIALPLLVLPFFFPLLTGFMAKSLGRKFWPWFFLGIPLPFVASIILLCLPVKRKKSVPAVNPVTNEELFDHLFGKEKIYNN